MMSDHILTRSWWHTKYLAKSGLRWLAYRTGVAALLGPRLNPNRRIILGFHTVADTSSAAYPGNVLSESSFRRILDRIIERGLPVVPLETMVSDLTEDPIDVGRDGFRVALTFDDGYVGCLDRVAPILMEYGFPATFFVCPGFIDRQDAKWDDLRFLTDDTFDKRLLRAPRETVDRSVERARGRTDEALHRRCAEALLDYEGLRDLQRR